MDTRSFAHALQGMILLTTVYSYWRGDLPVAISGAVAFTMTLMPIAFGMRTGFAIPSVVLISIALSLFLHVAGYSFGWYANLYPYYDKIAHFVSALTVALLGFLIVLLLHQLNRMRCPVLMIALFTVVFTLALGAAWEVLEFTIDGLFGTHLQFGLDDTIYDLVFDGFGALVVAGAGALWLLEHGDATASAVQEDEPASIVLRTRAGDGS